MKNTHKRAYRLNFSDEERAEPQLKKPINKVEKAEKRLEKAEAKIPTKKVLTAKKAVDAKGKKSLSLRFEEVDKKKPPSKLTHAIEAAPALEVHRQIHEYEDDNVGVEAAHKSEEAAEFSVRAGQSAYHSHKLKPYRESVSAEKQLDKANVNYLQQKAAKENPQLSSNPVSRWQQKQAIKKEYAAAKAGKAANTTQKTAESAKKAAKKTAEGTKKTGEFIARHKKGFLIIGGIAVMLVILMNCMSSCSVMFQAGIQSIAASTYPSEDSDMLGAEAAYCALEAELQYEVDHYETIHSGYDEYHYDLEDIEHDPYVLISILTAYHGGVWTLSEVQGTMAMLFEKQYQLTEEVVTEIRYRTETRTGSYSYTDPETGETTTETYEYDVQVPYYYYICTVTLNNENLSHLPIYIMGQEQVGIELYRASHKANIACRDAIDDAIRNNYRDNCLGSSAAKQVIADFGFDRTLYVLANTVKEKDWDGRIDRKNKEWARTVTVFDDDNGFGDNRNREFVVDRSHPGLLDLFVTQARREHLLSLPLSKEDIQREAWRVIEKLQQPKEPNSPSGTHFIAEISPDFLLRAKSKDTSKLSAMLPFQSLTLSTLEGRKSVYAVISKEENRNQSIQKRKPSVRDKLRAESKGSMVSKAPTHKEVER